MQCIAQGVNNFEHGLIRRKSLARKKLGNQTENNSRDACRIHAAVLSIDEECALAFEHIWQGVEWQPAREGTKAPMEEDSAGRGAALAGEGTCSCSRGRSAGSDSLFVQGFCIRLSLESHSTGKRDET